jgi:hypothetical protein
MKWKGLNSAYSKMRGKQVEEVYGTWNKTKNEEAVKNEVSTTWEYHVQSLHAAVSAECVETNQASC